MRIRVFEEQDRRPVELLMDDLGDELAAMDPYGRVIRAVRMGRHAVARMLDRVRTNDGHVLVAIDGDDLVGFAAGEIHRRDPDERFEMIDFTNGEVSELYVTPDRRRRGIARALLRELDRLRAF